MYVILETPDVISRRKRAEKLNKKFVLINEARNNYAKTLEKYKIKPTKMPFTMLWEIKDDKTIIEVYLGEKPTTGYSVRITKIIKHKEKLIVYVNESCKGEVHAMVITSPYEIVEVNGTYDNVVFELIGKDR